MLSGSFPVVLLLLLSMEPACGTGTTINPFSVMNTGKADFYFFFIALKHERSLDIVKVAQSSISKYAKTYDWWWAGMHCLSKGPNKVSVLLGYFL